VSYSLGRKVLIASLFVMGLSVTKVLADTEIDLGDNIPAPSTKPAAVPTPAPALKAQPTPTAVISAAPTPTPGEEKTAEVTEEEEATPTDQIVHGTLKMKDIYSAGIKNYQDQDYDSAIRYLKKALEMDDPYSQKFYYAEAAAMLGVIYQFHIIHYDRALHYYQLALKYEKNNSTARKHLKEVKRMLKKGE
jgi:tetratricopeptide (TPR) repeat protein